MKRELMFLALAFSIGSLVGCATETSDKSAAVEPPAASSSPSPAPAHGHSHNPQLHVTATGDGFEPKELHVSAGDRITLLFENRGTTTHGIRFDLPGGERELEDTAGGSHAMLAFPAPDEPGEYTFTCPVPGHKETGKLIVSPGHAH
jgi:plastocyanin